MVKMIEEIQTIREQAARENRNFVWVFHQMKAAGIESYAYDLQLDKKTFIRGSEKVEERLGISTLQFGAYNLEGFKKAVKKHQQGQTSYLQWLHDTASNGIYRYIVLMAQDIVVYLNQEDTQAYVETIPSFGT
jgi:uncharacterized protein YbcV (DUF1398 family)